MGEAMPDRMQSALTKVPPVTLEFWIIKILATTFGESAGDTGRALPPRTKRAKWPASHGFLYFPVACASAGITRPTIAGRGTIDIRASRGAVMLGLEIAAASLASPPAYSRRVRARFPFPLSNSTRLEKSRAGC